VVFSDRPCYSISSHFTYCFVIILSCFILCNMIYFIWVVSGVISGCIIIFCPISQYLLVYPEVICYNFMIFFSLLCTSILSLILFFWFAVMGFLVFFSTAAFSSVSRGFVGVCMYCNCFPFLLVFCPVVKFFIILNIFNYHFYLEGRILLLILRFLASFRVFWFFFLFSAPIIVSSNFSFGEFASFLLYGFWCCLHFLIYFSLLYSLLVEMAHLMSANYSFCYRVLFFFLCLVVLIFSLDSISWSFK